MIAAVFIILAYVLYFLYCVVDYTVIHLIDDLQVTSFTQILYNMKIEQGTTANEVWIDAFKGFFNYHGKDLIFWGFMALAAIIICLHFWMNKREEERDEGYVRKNTTLTLRGLGIASLVLCLATAGMLGVETHNGLGEVGFYKYMAQRNEPTNFYEENFINPRMVPISFPEKKNLIYIFLESMEVSYGDKEHGGFYEESLIPNLQQLSLENNSFSDGKTLNGGITPVNTSWTMAGMLAQTSGTPYIYVEPHGDNTGDQNDWHSDDVFLPGLMTLGDILKNNGYRNYVAFGSDGKFAGRENYYRQHGDYEVYDWNFLSKNGYLPSEDYRVFWGNDDKYLFAAAKDLITKAAQQEGPFNFTMLTVDTHYPDGWQCDLCEDIHETPMKNAISCSDHQLADFIKWIQEQPFADDTVIILAGDHESMSAELGQELKGYPRTTFYTIINGPEYTGPKRTFTTLDLFPTTLAAIGAEIPGDRLGLGTNLFSKQPTLVETMGIESLNDEIPRSSDYFIETVLKGRTEGSSNTGMDNRYLVRKEQTKENENN